MMTMSAGIGRAEGDLGQLAKMAQRPDAAQRWRRAKVLVIDEVLAHFCLPPQHNPPQAICHLLEPQQETCLSPPDPPRSQFCTLFHVCLLGVSVA